jgi:hypothetical protein
MDTEVEEAHMAGHFNHDIVSALNDAVVKVFWTKNDMRRLLEISGVDQRLISAQDWQAYKYHIISPIVDRLNTTEEGLGPLRRILQETLRYKDCRHLLRFTNGKALKADAEKALERLRALVEGHDAARATEEEEREARRLRLEQAKKEKVFQEKLAALRSDYMALLAKSDENERGYDLEKLLNELFNLFELAPQSPSAWHSTSRKSAATSRKLHGLKRSKMLDSGRQSARSFGFSKASGLAST